jgi:riboflavin kinase/FMN adenylyltransferase
MELIRDLSHLHASLRGCVLTIGNFDGVHLGHQALIARTRELATLHRLPVAVMIFEPTPREYFAGKQVPRQVPGRIAEWRSKLRLLERAGVERVICVRFGLALSKLSAEVFVQELLVHRLGVKAVVIGDDFRFGAGRAGDLALLKRLGAASGFSAEGLGSVRVHGLRCSSTALREALCLPDLERASQLLGHSYSIIGRVRRGLQLGRKLGMPTANIHLRRQPALHLGIYVVRARCGESIWNGVANLGVRPTLGLTRCLLETHLFGASGELYGRELEVEFLKFLRPELRFDSLDALAAQMQDDARAAKAYLSIQSS